MFMANNNVPAAPKKVNQNIDKSPAHSINSYNKNALKEDKNLI